SGPANGGPGGGTGGPVGAGGTTIAPALPPAPASFAGSPLVVMTNRGGGFPVSFRATGRLTGRAILVSTGKVHVRRHTRWKRRVTLARMSFTVLPSGKVRLWVRLSRANFRILTLNRRITTRITVIVTNAAGRTRTST